MLTISNGSRARRWRDSRRNTSALMLLDRRGGRRRMSLGSREGEQEGAAVVEVTFGADGAGVGAHDVLGDGQAEAGAAGFAGAGFIDAVKAFEEAGQMLGGDSGAEVTHIELDGALRAAGRGCSHTAGAEFDAAAGPSVFHGVVDEVGEYLVDGFAIGKDWGQRFNGVAVCLHVHNL